MSTPPDESLRASASRATHQRLLDAAVALLAQGELPNMRSVAAAAKVAERTVYRYFENLEVLRAAVQKHVRDRGHLPLPARAEELETYAAQLFQRFDDNAELVLGLTALAGSGLRAEFGRTRSENLRGLRQLLKRSYPQAPKAEREKAAASLRALLSGSGWAYLRVSCGLSPAQVVASAQWAIRAAHERLVAAQLES